MISANEVSIQSGAYAGWGSDGTVADNKVTIAGDKVSAKTYDVVGGFVSKGDAERNTVTVSGYGASLERVSGGQSHYGDSRANSVLYQELMQPSIILSVVVAMVKKP